MLDLLNGELSQDQYCRTKIPGVGGVWGAEVGGVGWGGWWGGGSGHTTLGEGVTIPNAALSPPE